MAITASFLMFCSLLWLWKLVCLVLRSRRAKFLATLDPVRDARKLLWYNFTVEFPFLSQKALEAVGLRPFMVPSISGILYKTKQFTHNPAKRGDDTDLLLKEMIFHHIDSRRGSYALGRINAMHEHYPISNDQLVYVLCMYTLHPIDAAARFGYRRWNPSEQLASYIVWHDIGIRMGIKHIPKSISDMRVFMEEYESENAAFDENNAAITLAMRNMMKGMVPALMRPLVDVVLPILMGHRLRMATGFQKPKQAVEFVILGCIKFACGTFVDWFMPPRPTCFARERFTVDWSVDPPADPHRLRELKINLYKPSVYRHGYKLSELGALKPSLVGKPKDGPLLCPLFAIK